MGFWGSHIIEFYILVRTDSSATMNKAQQCRVKIVLANIIIKPYSLRIFYLKECNNNYDVYWFESMMKKMQVIRLGNWKTI